MPAQKRKRGRPVGRPSGPSNPKPGSQNEYLSTFEVGEVRYIETTHEDHARAMRLLNTPPTRRPDSMAGMEFKTELWRALSAADIAQSMYLIRVTRLA